VTAPQGGESTAIVAVVNGDVISRGDVDARRRLFALSSGLPVTNDILDRLTPQVTRQLIDERLRLQETQRRRVVVQDKQIADAIQGLERSNNLSPGLLAKRLEANGVSLRTLIDQIRVQIAWGQLLRQAVGQQGEPSEADIADQAARIKSAVGQPEYRVGEIFTPVATPSQDAEARRFVDTVIIQLRAGAPFPVVAAQFSQSQTALQGGDLGWVQGANLDPAVLKVVQAMPPGAVSNPIKVAGGYDIVTLIGKREVGRDMATLARVRQVFLPFTQKLDPTNVTPQQVAQLETAKRLSGSLRSCDAAEAANKAAGAVRPSDPGELRLETLSPQLRALLVQLPVGQASPPLPSEEGIMVVVVCSREQKNLGEPSREALMDKIFNERIELVSRQMMRDLQRRAVIDQRA
jgi:peptidyl-prolyl cis-trans isomerase SurA